jgi:hypothetical protein
MSGATPKRKISEITDQVNRMGRELMDGESLNMLAWRRIFKDLEVLDSVPDQRAESLLLRVVLWGFRNDRENALRLLNIYAGLYGKDQDWHMIRSTLAPMFGDAGIVAELIQSAYPAGSPRDLGKVVTLCSHVGLFVSADRAITDISKLNPEKAQEVAAEYYFIPEAARYIKEHSVSERDVADRVTMAAQILLSKGYPLTHFIVEVDDFGIAFRFVVDDVVSKLVELDLSISDALAEAFEQSLSEHLCINITPHEEVA